MAESLGVSRQAVSKWEQGTSEPSTSNMIALAKLYGVTPEELLSKAKIEFQTEGTKLPLLFVCMRIFRIGLLVGKTSKWTITDVWMHLTQREKKVENGDFGRKLGKVKSREMVLSEKMMLSELASSSFFHLLLTIFLLCYFELFPVTGAGINLFLRLRTRESGGCILLYFGRFPYYQPVR